VWGRANGNRERDITIQEIGLPAPGGNENQGKNGGRETKREITTKRGKRDFRGILISAHGEPKKNSHYTLELKGIVCG